jgi:acyl carrier protein
MKAFDKENIIKEIGRIVAEVLEKNPEEIDPEAEFVKDLGMDSMMALEILAAVEKKFKIVIPEDYLPKFTTLNQTVFLVEQIINKGKERKA